MLCPSLWRRYVGCPSVKACFPNYGKGPNVVPVFKKGSVKDPRCYRSVSLIPLFGKILEKVAYVSLMRHVEPVIAPEQHGFVRGRSCATNLATLLSAAWRSIEEKSQTDCIYTDFSAAFQKCEPHSLDPQAEKFLSCIRNGSKLVCILSRKQATTGRRKRQVLGVVPGHVGHT